LASPAADRRERRKAETRRRLLDAARRLFVERGYDATRPQDVARAADVGAGTFYLHFADKRDAFRAFTEEAAEELMAVTRDASRGARGFGERLRRSLAALLAYSDSHPGLLTAAFADAAVIAAGLPRGAGLRERMAASLAQSLREGMVRGELHRDYDPDVLAHGITGLVREALGRGVQRGMERDALVDEITRFCSRALVRRDAAGPATEAPTHEVRNP